VSRLSSDREDGIVINQMASEQIANANTECASDRPYVRTPRYASGLSIKSGNWLPDRKRDECESSRQTVGSNGRVDRVPEVRKREVTQW